MRACFSEIERKLALHLSWTVGGFQCALCESRIQSDDARLGLDGTTSLVQNPQTLDCHPGASSQGTSWYNRLFSVFRVHHARLEKIRGVWRWMDFTDEGRQEIHEGKALSELLHVARHRHLQESTRRC